MFGYLFRLSLMLLCVAGFFYPVAVQALGGLILFWLVFGPPRKKPRE